MFNSLHLFLGVSKCSMFLVSYIKTKELKRTSRFFHILVCFALSVLSSYVIPRSVVKGICLLSCSFVLTQFLLPLLLLAYIFMYLQH